MYYFTSDLHLGCDEILERESRPFSSIHEFEDTFVRNINEVATRDDTLFVIGDWFNYNSSYQPHPSKSVGILKNIYAKTVLIMGNGEERIVKDIYNNSFDAFRTFCINAGFKNAYADYQLSFGGRTFFMTHYPRNHKDGFVNLFGHTHRATGLWKPYGINVGIDLNHFRPFSEFDILNLLETKESWWDIDEDCNCM